MESPVSAGFDPAGDRGRGRDRPGRAHRRRLPPHSRSGRSPGRPAARRTARPDVAAGERGGQGGRAPAATRVVLLGRAREPAARKVPHGVSPNGPGGCGRDRPGEVPTRAEPPRTAAAGLPGTRPRETGGSELRPLGPLSGRPAFPAVAGFSPRADAAHRTELGRMRVRRGAGPFRAAPPGPGRTARERAATGVFREAGDRGETRAFRAVRGGRGASTDGLPGPSVRGSRMSGEGGDVRTGGSASAEGGARSPVVPGRPDRAAFRPGAENVRVTRRGGRRAAKGFGRYGTGWPGARRGEVGRGGEEAALRRAQGRRGGAAGGFPGPETRRRFLS